MKATTINRRKFMEGAAMGIAGLASLQTSSQASGAPGANERIRLAAIGTGGQGTFHLQQWARMDDVQIVAVCDVDQRHLDRAAEVAGSSPRKLKDFRHVLDMRDVDAVCIATPDHWHAIQAIRSCEAGKAIYLEKPIAHDVREGRAVAEAARKRNIIVLHGTQQRSGPHWVNAVERIKAGKIGKVSMVHAWNAWNAPGIFGNLGRPRDGEAPEGVDYSMWLGPAPERQFNPLRFHRTWYYFWDYSGGMVSGWGVHLFDVVAWAMGPAIPSVDMTGGKFVHDDARETPDTATAVFECPGYTLYYSMRHANALPPHGDMDHGIEFFGTKGTLQINRRGFQIHDEGNRDRSKPRYSQANQVDDPWEHKRHFLACIRGDEKPKCDAEAGHRASLFGHLANIAYRIGRRIRWDAANETILDDPQASRRLGREYRKPWTL